MLVAILSAFAGGLILNFMPCVFPIISLKAFGLMRQGGDPARMRREGLAFMAGVVAAMLVLAAILIAVRAGGTAVGWGFQLQSPVVIALLILVMLGSALNLTGLFEMGLSLQSAGQGIQHSDGLIGAALTGVLSIVIATPCTAPLMAGALGYALLQPPLVSLTIFFALAIGFAAPFTVLCFVPAIGRRLPKPGPWMAVVKQALAFPMFGAAAWLVWVLTLQTDASGLVLILACGVALGFAAWLYGIAQRRSLAGRPARGLYTGVSAVTLGIIVLIAAPSSPLRTASGTGAVASVMPSSAQVKPVAWSPDALAAARATGKPVFVNFTASWCVTCQVNDKVALETQDVQDAMARTGAIYMIADSTNYNPDIEAAMTAFGRDGLPLYAVYPSDGGPAVLLSQILTKEIVVDALQQAVHKPV